MIAGEVVVVEDELLKKKIVSEVLADLPEWFGLPLEVVRYVEHASKYPLWSMLVENKYIGFISIKETSQATAEIYCMEIKKEYHHKGYGRLMIRTVEEVLKKQYQLLQVKTVAPNYYPCYDQTNQFYHANGFLPLEIFPTLWDEWNPCLLLVKPLSVNNQ